MYVVMYVAGDIEKNWAQKHPSRLPLNVCCDGCFDQCSCWILHPSLAEAEQSNGGSIRYCWIYFSFRFWTWLLSLIQFLCSPIVFVVYDFMSTFL